MAAETQSHIIVMPKGFMAVRIFQSIFAFFVLGVNIYGAISAPIPGIILNIFTALATIITLIYIRVATYQAPNIYQYWAILSLEIFCLIFWLISFALLASEVAVAAAVACGGGYYNYYGEYYSDACSGTTLGVIGLFGAAAGVGGIEFILFIVSLSMFSVRLARHRNAGGHSTPGAMATASATTAAAPAYNMTQTVDVPEKAQMQPQAQVYPTNPAPPQNGYYPPQGVVDARYGGAPAPQANQQYAPVQQQYPPVQQQYPPVQQQQQQFAPTQQQYAPSQPQSPQQVPQQLDANQQHIPYPTHAQQLPADPIQHPPQQQ